MTYTPQPLRDLKNWLEAQNCSVSIVRDCQPNRNAYGYHLGKDEIFSTTWCVDPTTGKSRTLGDRDYSVQTVRDKAGLSNGRSAIDIQLPPKRLQEFSKWLVAKCMKGLNNPGWRSNMIREVIYSPDGVNVWRYDHETGTNTKGGGDDSHLWHTHVSFYRDTELLGKVRIFRSFFIA